MAKNDNNDDPNDDFQFGDDVENQTWFRRALKSGVHYVKHYSERSGLKLLPELELEEAVSQPKASRAPAALKAAVGANAVSPVRSTTPQRLASTGKALAPAPKPKAPPPPAGDQFADKPLFQTAIHSFMANEKQKPAGRNRGPMNATYYAAQVEGTSRWVKVVCWTLALGAVLGAGYALETRYRVSEMVFKLRDKNESLRKGAPHKGGRAHPAANAGNEN